jgi:aromatic-L-amino-acid decarboxylase
MTPDEFREYGRQVVDWIADYWESIESRPVGARVKPGDVAALLPSTAPEKGEPFSAFLADMERVVMPGITHWQHPSFYAYFPANASGPAVLGDLLSSGLAVQGMLWATSPAVTEVETVVMDWLATLLGLPERFLGSGVIQDTASSSVLLRPGRRAAQDLRRHGAYRRDPRRYAVYLSPESHSAGEKAVRIAGLGDAAIRVLDVDPSSLSVTADSLRAAVAADRAAGVTPAVRARRPSAPPRPPRSTRSARSASSAGPRGSGCTSTPRTRGSAAVCPELRWLERRPRARRLVRDQPAQVAADQLRLRRVLGRRPGRRWSARSRCCRSSSATRRPNPARSSTTGTGRSRSAAASGALKLWAVLRWYGAQGLARAHPHRRRALAQELAVLGPRRPAVRGGGPRTRSAWSACAWSPVTRPRRRCCGRSTSRARAYLSHTRVHGRYVLRVSIGATFTERRHVEALWALLQRLAPAA